MLYADPGLSALSENFIECSSPGGFGSANLRGKEVRSHRVNQSKKSMLSRSTRIAALGLMLALFVPTLALLTPTPRPNEPHSLSGSMHLLWQRQEPPLEPTWPDQPRFTNDVAPRPIVVGSTVLLTSSKHDWVQAVDAFTGQLRWRCVVEGPVRFAPTVWKDRVYFVADDGYLYCVGLDDGELLWKVRGGPSDRRILGNERLICTWPARGAPVVAPEKSGGATVYFAAGIWPFMGIFLHAVDARTGESIWCNSGDGSDFIKQPHQTDAFAGLAPSGSIVVIGDRLLVPGGRSIVACYDRHTGQRLHYRLADVSKLAGGPDVLAASDVYFNGGGAFDLINGNFLGTCGNPYTIQGQTLFSILGTNCRIFDLDRRPPYEPDPESVPDASGKKPKKKDRFNENWLGEPLASVRVPRSTTLLAAHGRLYGAGPGTVYAVELASEEAPRVIWKAPIDGTPIHLAAGDEQLVVSTREGNIYAFGLPRVAPKRYPRRVEPLPTASKEIDERTKKILATVNIFDGYALFYGADVESVEALLRESNLRLLILESRRDRARRLREQLHRADLDSKRVSVIQAAFHEAELPAYLASLVLADGMVNFDAVWHTLRPYGGTACWTATSPMRTALRAWVETRSADESVALEERNGLLLLRRKGELSGAANWTHQHADAANTRVSRDARVKAPLGILWFGGPGNDPILPRHGHGPVPQVSEGRLFIEGADLLRAIDIYTGRLLWEARLPGLGAIYDNTAHQPGANAAGSNYVSTPEGIFVAYQDTCLRLDPATGKELERFQLPPLFGESRPPKWSFVTGADQYLIGGAGPVVTSATDKTKKQKGPPPAPSASKRLTVLDRSTGRQFSIEAEHGFRHNAICVGNGRLYAIDLPQMIEVKKARKSDTPDKATKVEKRRDSGRLVAYELATGKLLWSLDKNIFGTWLSYSTKHDVLVEAGLMSRDTLNDEPAGMAAYRGQDGSFLWRNKDYFGPALIHGDRVLKGGDSRAGSGTACELLTGKPIRVPDPITGEPIEWRWVRTYGCNTPAASEHLVLFRSGAAGFYDLANEGGTGNIGGFRSSCTFNMIPAGGILTVPDYTRTCICSYQNQCSIALIHAPETELWTFTTSRPITGVVRRLGVNLGAPGSRRADDGTLWIDYPQVGGPSPKLSVKSIPARPTVFRLHSSQVEGKGLKWVAGYGCRGLSSLTVDLGNDKGRTRRYTVALTFLEPDGVNKEARLFDVALQGKTVLTRLDVVAEAGGPRRPLVRTFEVDIERELTITLTPFQKADVPETLLSGVEVKLLE